MADKRLKKNILSLLVWQGGNYLVPMLTFPYLTRVLGPEQYGSLGLGFGVVSYCIVIGDWGFNYSASRDIAQANGNKERTDYIFWNTMASKLILAAATLLALSILIWLVPKFHTYAAVLYSTWLMVLGNLLSVNWFLQGLERLGSFAGASLVGKFLTLPATFLLVHHPGDAWVAAAIQGVGTIFGGVCSLWIVRAAKLVGASEITLSGIRSQLRRGGGVLLHTMAHSIYTSSGSVVLAFYTGNASVGLYAGSDRIRTIAQNLIQPITQATYPRSSRLMTESISAGLRFLRKIIIIQASLTFVISIGIYVFAPTIVSILMGPRFAGAIPVLRMLSFLPFIVGINNAIGIQTLLPLGYSKEFATTSIVATAINLGCLLVFTYLWSAVGAAAAAVLTELSILVQLLFLLHRKGINYFSAT